MLACDVIRVLTVGLMAVLGVVRLLFCAVLLSAPSQIVGFVTGAAVVATIGSFERWGIDALSFGISVLMLMAALRAWPAPQRATGETGGHLVGLGGWHSDRVRGPGPAGAAAVRLADRVLLGWP
jgi:hypothetical protein